MTNTLKFLVFVSLLIKSIAIFGQKTYEKTPNREFPENKQEKKNWLINKSDYIVDGGIVETVGSFVYNDDVYTIRKMQVRHIYRGANIQNYIYFVHKNPNFKPDKSSEFPYIHCSDPTTPCFFQLKGIYFLKKNEIPITLPDTSKLKKTSENIAIQDFFMNPMLQFNLDTESDNIFQPMDENEFGLNGDMGDNPNGEKYHGLYGTESFNSEKSLYCFLQKYNNINIPNDEYCLQENGQKSSKEKQDSTIKKKELIEIRDSSQIKKFNNWLKRGQDYSIRQLQKSNIQDTVNCILYADYQHIEYINNKFYYKFDLSVKYESYDVDTVYPEEILLFFQYNTNAFGPNIISNGKFSCILDPAFADTADYEIDFQDHIINSNQAALMIGTKYKNIGDWNYIAKRTAIPIFQKVKIANIAIEVADNIVLHPDEANRMVHLTEVWNHLDFNVNRWAYDATTYGYWDTVTHINFELNHNYIIGKPTIDSILSNNNESIIAGCGQRLTIKGSGFMEYSNIINGFENEFSSLMLRNADGKKHNNQIKYTTIDYSDIISWTDTCITFNIPSNTYGNPNDSELRYSSVGSGPIKITNILGTETISSQDIIISASILNTYNTNNSSHYLYNKQIPYWARINCSDQIQFEVNSSISDIYLKKIQKAFDEWNRILGYTFYTFKKDENGNIKRTNINSSIADEISVIYIDRSYSNSYAGVMTPTIINENFLYSCNSTQQNKYARREIDMYINDTALENLTTTEQLHTFIHELGHGLGLGHVLTEDDNMYPIITKTYTSIQQGARLGAKKIFDISDTVVWSCSNIENINTNTTSCIPNQPTDLSATAISKTSIQITWSSDPKATSYTLRRSLNSDMSDAQTVNIPSNYNNYTDTSLTQNTQYYYQIQANNTNGSSSYSYIKNAKTKRRNIPNNLNDVRVENNGMNSINVKWVNDTTNTIQNYIIERQEDNGLKAYGTFHVIAVLNSTSTEFYDYDIEEGITYNYRIKYTTAEGVSPYTPTTSVTPTEYNEHSIILPISRNAQLYKNEYSPFADVENTNYNNHEYIRTWKWTHSGWPTYIRSLFDFDLSQIPKDAIIESAILELKGVDHQTNITEHNTGYKSNESWIELVTEYWDETQVTWNTQPTSSSTYRVELNNSSTRTQNYSADITELITQMISDTTVHGLLLRLKQENCYTRMTFASPTYSVDSLRPFVSIKYITAPLLTLENHPQKDAAINISGRTDQEDYEHSYFGDKETLICQAWTNNGKIFNLRSLIDFDISEIPSNATIINATLDLYSPSPQSKDMHKHFSYNIMHNSGYKSNESFLCKITEPWNENSVTWHNQPSYDTTRNVLLPESTSHSQDYLNINITNLIQEMVSQPDSAFGLMLVLRNENKYARMVFASSDFHDVSRHPRLVIDYKVYPNNMLKSFSSNSSSKLVDYKSMKYLDVNTENVFLDSIPTINVQIMPNPSKGKFSIISNKQIKTYSIYNSAGMMIQTDFFSDYKRNFLIDLTKYGCGMYVIMLKLDDETLITKKLIVNQ